MGGFGSFPGYGSGARKKFNGNRTITRVGLPNINVGVTTGDLEDFNEEYFFPPSAPTLAISIANNVQEKGTSFAPTIVADYTEKDSIVTARRLYKNNVLINQPATNDFSYTDAAITATTIYKVIIDFTVEGVPGSLVKEQTVYFYAPTYIFLGPLSMTEAQIKAAAGVSGKKIWDKQSRYDIAYTGANTHPQIAEPKSNNGFSQIKDQNQFVVTSGFESAEMTFTLADGVTTEVYTIRKHTDTTSVNGFKYNFLR